MATSKSKTKTKSKRPSRTKAKGESEKELRTFDKLADSYGLPDPYQIQMKILWTHIKALVRAQFDGKETDLTLSKYDSHWKICENRISSLKTLRDKSGTQPRT